MQRGDRREHAAFPAPSHEVVDIDPGEHECIVRRVSLGSADMREPDPSGNPFRHGGSLCVSPQEICVAQVLVLQVESGIFC